MMFPQYVVSFLLFIPQTMQAMMELSDRAELGIECKCPAKRTLFNITWNCISTIIICAWVSVDPNVPPSGLWKGLRLRLEMMFWTIIGPELILAWAVRQWFAAWEIRDTVNGTRDGLITGVTRTVRGWFREKPTNLSGSGSRKWTMAHGHLLGMGGITTVDPAFEDDDSEDPDGQVLSLERYKQLRDTGFELPKITASNIKDRSKGDFLSKLIAILQTSWFILQCIARGQQRLALTELELVTLALASLNGITYAFWWHKPLGVQEPVRIYFKAEAKAEQHSEAQDETSGISAYHVVRRVAWQLKDGIEIFREVDKGVGTAVLLLFIGVPIILFVIFSLCLFIPFPLGIILLLKILRTSPVIEEPSGTRGLIAARIVLALRKLRYQLTSYITTISQKWLRDFLDENSESAFWIGWHFILPSLFILLLATTICFLPFFALFFLFSFIFTAVFGIITSNTVAPGASQVPTFYAPTTNSDKYSRMVVFAVFGVIFGGLHCIGWNFTYPTPFEQHLWRATSLAITVIPLAVAPIDYILDNFELTEGFGRVLRLVLDLIMTILLFVYVPARLSLIAQALALLRTQPETAFLAVDWTQYIPHIL